MTRNFWKNIMIFSQNSLSKASLKKPLKIARMKSLITYLIMPFFERIKTLVKLELFLTPLQETKVLTLMAVSTRVYNWPHWYLIIFTVSEHNCFNLRHWKSVSKIKYWAYGVGLPKTFMVWWCFFWLSKT